MTNLQIRVDESLLHQAQEVVEDLGIDLTSAIHLFFTKNCARKYLYISRW
ncbi:MAG: type II toxin-antitoxin system RelB/DinJ family antitoxin [Desulfovibrionaceae bacterium]|nr:type II toxin-antitoxin system RelB/DinJ family antitoxin [Desulfovibrionaceae bacterium]